MDLLGFLGFLAAVLFFAWLLIRGVRSGRRIDRESEARDRDMKFFLAGHMREVKNPATPIAVLQSYLVMEVPHDQYFYLRLQILRVLSQNPSLPAELQAAAVNRVSQEEASAHLDRAFQKMSKSMPKGFIGISTDI